MRNIKAIRQTILGWDRQMGIQTDDGEVIPKCTLPNGSGTINDAL